MSCETIVRVMDLPLLADIGINPDEIGRRQPLVISIEVWLQPAQVSAIEDTIDYRAIVHCAEKLALVHIPLIETFGQHLVEECLKFARALRARVTIDKPFAITRGLAGIVVTAEKPSEV